MNILVYYNCFTLAAAAAGWFGKEQENWRSTKFYPDNDRSKPATISLSMITSFNGGRRLGLNTKRLAIDRTIIHNQLSFDDCFRCLCAVSNYKKKNYVQPLNNSSFSL